MSNRLGEAVRRWRRQQGYTQFELASRVGATQGWATQLEWRGFPQLVCSYMRLARVIGFSPNEMAELDGCWQPERPADKAAKAMRSLDPEVQKSLEGLVEDLRLLPVAVQRAEAQSLLASVQRSIAILGALQGQLVTSATGGENSEAK